MIIFVDLDETLIHTIVLDSYGPFVKSLSNDGYFLQPFVKPHLTRIRPFAHRFLSELSSKYAVCLFTNGNDFYADAILKHFDLGKYFTRIYSKQNSGNIITDYNADFKFKLVDDAIIGSDSYRLKSDILQQDIGDRLINVKPFNCELDDIGLLSILYLF